MQIRDTSRKGGMRPIVYSTTIDCADRDVLREHRSELFCLTISLERLHQIRSERRPESRYAACENRANTSDVASRLMRGQWLRAFGSTRKPITEIASTITHEARPQWHAC